MNIQISKCASLTIFTNLIGLLSGQEYADLFGSHEISRLGIGRFVKNLTDVLHEQIETPSHEKQVKPKMYLYSGHDNTLSPMLNAFKVISPSLQINMESKIRNEKIWIGAFSDAPNK